MEPLTRVDTTGLFPALNAELITLLRGLDDADWQRPTVGGSWCGAAKEAAARVAVDADTVWRILYNALPADAARAHVTVDGDRALVEPMLHTWSVMV